ncbi:MAG TPA: hypothetical protein ENJ42_01075 [Hellea balneolensis]|uniref:Divergent polysaccharide deacetylase family protein n=1 Tax=Hellea balneolensis TaxID=287478 RepID=A0A7C5QZM1_9PROT|nr:hypothetical protein [Hellea balneolensis]
MRESSLNQRRKLPSLRKHGLSAVLLLAIFSLALFGWMSTGKQTSAPKVPDTTIPLPKQPVEIFADKDQPLPDLLAQDNIPLDENPTETLKMIGGLGPGTSTPGPRPPTPSTQTRPGPKTVLINGQPLNAAQTKTSQSPLVRVPIAGLSSMSPFGKVPHIAPDGRKVLTSYARPFSPKPEQKYISIVVGGLGLNPVVTNRAITELPGDVTLSFAALAPNLQDWIHKARAHGHEVLIELPMDGGGPAAGEPGANLVLSPRNQDSINIRRLDRLLSRAEGYFAVTNYGGDILLNSDTGLGPILAQLHHYGLGFIYDGSLPDNKLKTKATKSGLKTISARAYLDEQAHDKNAVITQLTRLSKMDGTPIGMGFSYNETIDGILAWLREKPATLSLAPASYPLLAGS